MPLASKCRMKVAFPSGLAIIMVNKTEKGTALLSSSALIREHKMARQSQLKALNSEHKIDGRGSFSLWPSSNL